MVRQLTSSPALVANFPRTRASQFAAAADAGLTTFKTAKTPAEIDAVVRKTFIQGTLSIIFAPKGLLPTSAEREVETQWLALDDRPVRTGGH